MKKIALYESRRNNNELNLSNFQDLYGLENDGYEYYCDSVKSRTKIMNRPELQRLIKDVKDGKIYKIIVPGINHISRNSVYAINFLKQMESNGCAVFDIYNNEITGDMLKMYDVISQIRNEEFKKELARYKAEKDYDDKREKSLKEYLKLNNLSTISRIGNEWDKFNVWFNEEKEQKKIYFINTNRFDDNYFYEVLICHNGISQIRTSIKTANDINNEEQMYELLSTMYDKYIDYKDLPRLSECSPLLQELYNLVANNNKNGVVISKDDWEKHFIGKYTEKDYEKLIDEKKLFDLCFGLELDNDYYNYDDDYYYENDDEEEINNFKIIVDKQLLTEINNDYALELNNGVEL